MRSRAFQFFTRDPPGEISLFFYFPCSATPRAASHFYYYEIAKDFIINQLKRYFTSTLCYYKDLESSSRDKRSNRRTNSL